MRSRTGDDPVDSQSAGHIWERRHGVRLLHDIPTTLAMTSPVLHLLLLFLREQVSMCSLQYKQKSCSINNRKITMPLDLQGPVASLI